jgi:hypothetical protein
MLRLAALLLVAGCANQPAISCDLDAQITADLTQQTLVRDCGRVFDLAVDGGLGPAMKSGHDCVLDAASRMLAFRFLYADPKTGLTAGLSGAPTAGRMIIKWYTAGAPAGKQLSVERCDDGIASAPSCTPSPGVPCLQCLTPEGALLCAG